jgi:hypothetical protein
MPCFSRTTETKMTEAERLAEVLTAQGFTVTTKSPTEVCTREGLSFSRQNATQPFTAYASERSAQAKLGEVGKSYAQSWARSWAKAKGMLVRSYDANTSTLTVVSTRS